MVRSEPAPGIPLLVSVIVLPALGVPTSWPANARLPLVPSAGTAPPNSLPMSAKVLDCTPPAGSPGPSTRKRLLPVGLPTTGTSTTASPMNPAGGAGVAPGAGVRNGPKRPASAAAKSQGPTAVTAQPMSIVVRPRRPAGTETVSVPYGCVMEYVPAGNASSWTRTRLNTAGSPDAFGAIVMLRMSIAVPPLGAVNVEVAM